MSNFEIFDRDYITAALTLFKVKTLRSFTPIRYEALTPDRFMLLFRASFENKEEQFFVMYQDDSVRGIKEASQRIEEWANTKIVRYIKPASLLAEEDFGNFSDPSAVYTEMSKFASKLGHYLTFIAHIEKPGVESYWTSHITLKPGDVIRETLPDEMTDAAKEQAIKSIKEIILRPWDKETDVIPSGTYVSLYHDPLSKSYDYFYTTHSKDEE